MKRGKKRNAVLGLQWDGSDAGRMRTWHAPVLSRLGVTPVLWSLPARPRGDAADFIQAVRARLGPEKDVVVPMGYGGAVHPLLCSDELEKELAWGVSNPWSTGVKDVFGVTAAALAPRVPDFSRPRAIELYAQAGFTHICAGWTVRSAPFKRGKLTIVPFTPMLPAAGTPAELSKLFSRTLDGSADAFLMVDAARFPSAEALTAYLDALLASLAAAGYTAAAPKTLLGKAGAESSGAPADPWPGLPVQIARNRISFLAQIQRKKRKKNDEYRAILDGLSFSSLWDEGRADIGAPAETREKTLVAHMQGDVTLAGTAFDARMSGGRFLGIAKQGRFLTPNAPAQSSMTIGGKTYRFKSRSAISFEGDAGTGLRDDLVLEFGSPRGGMDAGRLGIEYEFRGDASELCITAVLKYPNLQGRETVDAVTPLSFIVAEQGPDSPIQIAVENPDGFASSLSLEESEGWRAVPGTRWRIRGIELRAAPGMEKKLGICFFRVVKARGKLMVEANPFGCPHAIPAALVSGKTETHSLAMDLVKEGTRQRGGA
jgi:hypothetical protein